MLNSENTDEVLANNIWKRLQNDPFLGGEGFFFNRDMNTFILCDGMATATVNEGNVILAVSCAVNSGMLSIEIFRALDMCLDSGTPIMVIDDFYVSYPTEDDFMVYYGEKARVKFLEENCFGLFQEMSQEKEMKEYLEKLPLGDMFVC